MTPDKPATLLENFGFESEGTQSFAQLYDGRLISGGCDRTIRTWLISNSNCTHELQALKEHTEYISSIIQLIDGRIVAAIGRMMWIWRLSQTNVV
jgi:WD40 repeat protein